MSDFMLCGILRMPLNLHLSDSLFGPPQLQSRMIEAADQLELRADRIAALERENAELVEKVKRTRGSCNKLAKLLRDSERFIKDPSDKYAALAREHLLEAIDAALQPKAQEGK